MEARRRALVGSFEAMPGERDSDASGKGFDSDSLHAFPQFPGEEFMSHAATQYREQAEARFASRGIFMASAQGLRE